MIKNEIEKLRIKNTELRSMICENEKKIAELKSKNSKDIKEKIKAIQNIKITTGNSVYISGDAHEDACSCTSYLKIKSITTRVDPPVVIVEKDDLPLLISAAQQLLKILEEDQSQRVTFNEPKLGDLVFMQDYSDQPYPIKGIEQTSDGFDLRFSYETLSSYGAWTNSYSSLIGKKVIRNGIKGIYV